MKFRPLHDRVLIEVLDSEEKTSGGIIIPDTAKEKPQEGKVVAVGSGVAVAFAGLRTLHPSKSARYSHHNGNGNGNTYLSITCTTPFATITSLITTCALLTNTCLFTTSMFKNSWPYLSGNHCSIMAWSTSGAF